MKRLFVILMVSFFSMGTMCNKKVSMEDKMQGFWSTSFPLTDNMNGYIFDVDGSMYYSDNSKYNIKYRYDGSMGLWKITNHKIMVKINYNVIWKSKWIFSKNGFFEPGVNNKLFLVKHKNSKWISIGDTRLYTESKFYKDRKNSASKPENMLLKPIVNKEIVESTRFYWRICIFNNDNYKPFCIYPRDIIKAYRKLLIKKTTE